MGAAFGIQSVGRSCGRPVEALWGFHRAFSGRRCEETMVVGGVYEADLDVLRSALSRLGESVTG